ncbi:zinc-binding alcohol dehydrogenase [Plesiocystis pacifica SIR-1]|uniref:Zinc-binding alcohol dehydrogenase n=1 Tax=Plesiocystis pacifica SIR-1 TaxID=391625 RepID=A6GF23_9BACT|nr:zinc-binding dehydrogenase [Plesiocystis pacifica]EDM75550.1 zinc-binding alcohol dehydrogenase [Plesiocystis pacifica SIR-1]
MLAIILDEHGGPEVLRLETVADPTPGPGQVVLDVHACALNRLDIWVRGGLPNLRLSYPHVLGSDIAGIVRRVGPGVDESLIGREVVANPGVSCGRCEACLSGWDNLCPHYRILGENTTGGYAEQICVPVANLVDKPARLSMVEAAAFPLTFLTAWQMLVTLAQVQPGETVLIHAAGSGVGSAGLQIAKHSGARVIALASTDAKLAKAEALGADAIVRTSDEDWPKQVRALPGVGRRGVDVVFEHVGKATWKHSIKLCRRGGRVVTCGASSGWDADTDLRQVFFRQIQILGSTMGSKASLFRIAALIEAGAMSPVVDRVFPLAEAAAAHRYLDRREQFGKVVLEVRPSADA